MVGEGCVAIACDLRLGNQALTIACNFEKVRTSFQAPRVLLGETSATIYHGLRHCVLFLLLCQIGLPGHRSHLRRTTWISLGYYYCQGQTAATSELVQHEGGESD